MGGAWIAAVLIGLSALYPVTWTIGAEPVVIKNVRITPKFETAGIIVESDAASVSLEILGPKGFQAAFPFVRFDQNHLATSLFGLQPDTEYTIRIVRTEREFEMPRDEHVVRVDSMEKLQRAADAAEPGTTILVAPGIYRGQLVVRRSGAAGRPIVIRGEVKALSVPVWERKDLPVIEATKKDTGIQLDGVHHVVLDSLQVRNAVKHDQLPDGILFRTTTSRIWITGDSSLTIGAAAM
ncbi:MAG: hypothetical protein AMS22_17890 [Thiotrichales bacterium SG8_50]|nr:MAG: hypothetical protein AMS22_17890 [Thiotrichales bacterium SG8_50]